MSLEFAITGKAGDLTIQAASTLPSCGVTVLFGPSGTGKSTLLRMLAGLHPCAGMIRFGEALWQDEHHSSVTPVWQRPLGMLLQQPTLFEHLTVRGNLDYVQARRGCDVDVQQVVAVTRIDHLLDRRVNKLSGGEAQRVALARALVGKPELLLLDEPLSAVDIPHRESLLEMIKSVSRRIPILYVTHSMDELLLLADQVWLMEQGSLVAQGTVSTALVSLTGPLAQRSDASSLLEGVCADFDAADHLQTVSVGDARLLVPLAQPREPGSAARLRIAARDVSLCRMPPVQSSILNILPVTVEAVTSVGAGQHVVKLSLASQVLLARLSSRSVRELNIVAGEAVFAQVKAVALV